MVANKACACGAPVLAKGKCRRCYYVPYQARYRRKHRERLRAMNAEWQRKNRRTYSLDFDPLEIFCMALDCTPIAFARLVLSLRDPEREGERLDERWAAGVRSRSRDVRFARGHF